MSISKIESSLCLRMAGVLGAQTSEVKVEAASNNSLLHDRSSWVEFFVQEMMNTSNWDEVRGRISRVLEAFERSVLEQPTSSEDVYSSEPSTGFL